MLRQIILDTETTGLNPQEGHKIIEIGCVELINRKITGKNFHIYLNPERTIDQEAINIHGLTNEFLEKKPKFYHIAKELLEYIDGSEIIAHNARFDISFLEHEFSLLKKLNSENNENIHYQKPLSEFCKITDTLEIAKKKFPGQRNSLDALCKRYSIDNKHRELHGALLDANLLASVYLAMTGGQSSFEFQEEDMLITSSRSNNINNNINNNYKDKKAENYHKVKIIYASEEEIMLHKKMTEKL